MNFALFLVLLFRLSIAIPIDNSVDGEPEIECDATSINISFKTKNKFEGKVYVRGHVTEGGCVNQDHGRNEASLNLQFQTCGLLRTRSLNPKGVFVTSSIVISFHSQFLTKVDRAYTIQCFYMEAEKTVSQNIEASELTTFFQSQIAPMPVCRYEILDNGPTGNPVKFAVIGQQVYHKWTCDSQTTDIFCMTVHSCVVDDGGNNKVQILSDNGCALDKFILQNLEYTTDLMAGREAHVFKFADQPALFFQCQISITIKEPGQTCPKPQCTTESSGVVGGSIILSSPPAATAAPGKSPNPVVQSFHQPSPARPPSPSPSSTLSTFPVPTQSTATSKGIVPYVSAPSSVRLSYLSATRIPFDFGRTLVGSLDSPINDSDNSKKKKRRLARSMPLDELGVWDVRSQTITTFELEENSSSASASICNESSKIEKPFVRQYCFSQISVSLGISLGLISIFSIALLSCLYLLRMRKHGCSSLI